MAKNVRTSRPSQKSPAKKKPAAAKAKKAPAVVKKRSPPSKAPDQRKPRSKRAGRAIIHAVGARQIPVDVIPVELAFDGDSGFGLRVYATGDNQQGTYRKKTEFWNDNGRVCRDDELHLFLTQTAYNAAQLRGFLRGYYRDLEIEQVGTWTNTRYTPNADYARLFSAVDPDDFTMQSSIGLLLEQDIFGMIVSITWYKTTNVGTAFAREQLPALQVNGLQFTVVRDENDDLTTDPRYIDPNATWWRSTAQVKATSRTKRKPSPA